MNLSINASRLYVNDVDQELFVDGAVVFTSDEDELCTVSGSSEYGFYIDRVARYEYKRHSPLASTGIVEITLEV